MDVCVRDITILMQMNQQSISILYRFRERSNKNTYALSLLKALYTEACKYFVFEILHISV